MLIELFAGLRSGTVAASRLPIDVGNSIELRRILDEATIRVSLCSAATTNDSHSYAGPSCVSRLQAVDDLGYEEDHTMGNIKLAIMTFACAVALFAQFNPYEFPGAIY